MSERGTLRIVIEGDDAHRFHDGLMEFVRQSKENPETSIEDPVGELYWVLSDEDVENDIKDNMSTVDCYSFDGRFQGCTTIYWDAYRNEDGIVRMDVQWLNSLAFIALCCILIEDEGNLYYEYSSVNWGISTNDAQCKYFDKKIQVIDWDGKSVPDDWNKDWESLSFEQRIALCEEYGVIYIATQVE